MATHDYVIANGSGAAVRADLNDALSAIVTQNSSATAPTTTYAYQTWLDISTSPATIKQRDGSNASWVTIGYADGTIDLGTVGTPSIRFNGDTNTGIYSPGADQVAISTGGTEAMRIDSEGKLLINTTTSIPVGAGTASNIQLADSAGFQSLSRWVNGTGGPALLLGKSRSATVGTYSIVLNGDILGQVIFAGDDGTDIQTQAASIKAEVDGTPGVNDMPGRLVFSTTVDGASSVTERMRISSTGNILFGTTGVPNGTSIYGAAFENTSNDRQILKTATSVTTSGSLVAFYNPNGLVGTISVSGSATAYNTSSDYRLKENITPLTDATVRVQQLKPSRFNFIADPDTEVDGFIAHEVQEIVPEAITGIKDEVDEDGKPLYQGIDQSKLVPLLTAALQEALGKIADLETRLAALEAG